MSKTANKQNFSNKSESETNERVSMENVKMRLCNLFNNMHDARSNFVSPQNNPKNLCDKSKDHVEPQEKNQETMCNKENQEPIKKKDHHLNITSGCDPCKNNQGVNNKPLTETLSANPLPSSQIEQDKEENETAWTLKLVNPTTYEVVKVTKTNETRTAQQAQPPSPPISAEVMEKGSIHDRLMKKVLTMPIHFDHLNLPPIQFKWKQSSDVVTGDETIDTFIEALRISKGDYTLVDCIYKFKDRLSKRDSKDSTLKDFEVYFINCFKMFLVLESYYNPSLFDHFVVPLERKMDASIVEEIYTTNMAFVCSLLGQYLDNHDEFRVSNWSLFINKLVTVVDDNIGAHLCVMVKMITPISAKTPKTYTFKLELVTYLVLLTFINYHAYLALTAELYQLPRPHFSVLTTHVKNFGQKVKDDVFQIFKNNGEVNLETTLMECLDREFSLIFCFHFKERRPLDILSFRQKVILICKKAVADRFIEMFCK